MANKFSDSAAIQVIKKKREQTIRGKTNSYYLDFFHDLLTFV